MRSSKRFSLRFQVLAIALIPGIAFLGAGAGVSAYLLTKALNERQTATLLSDDFRLAVPVLPALSAERRASIAMASDPSPQARAAVDQARRVTDQALSHFRSASPQVASAMPRVFATRQQIDNGQMSRLPVFDAYNQVADALIAAEYAIGRNSTELDAGMRRSQAADLMRISDWLDRSNALADAAYDAGGLTPAEANLYDSLTKAYRAEFTTLEPRLPAEALRTLGGLAVSPDWIDLGRVEDALVRQSYDPRQARNALPVSVSRWQDAARATANALGEAGPGDLASSAAALEKQSADQSLTRSSIIAGASLVLGLIVLLVALKLGNSLVGRLRWLRDTTLDADSRLPWIVARIRDGEAVDADHEIPDIDYGSDEIGQVAAAFTTTQRTVISAAAQEIQLREGTKAAFLNIARRSQAVVERQLQLLDQAQRAAEDPDQIALLFKLDHLSTRERRNAENLIILGGGRLGRQWRASVRLIDLVRGAVAETEQYKRVAFGRLPEVFVGENAVTDLVHLLAELVDNAVDFSPPESRIEVRGSLVGRGVIVEIEDQGLGMSPQDREQFHAMFREPPDFDVMVLTEDARIGFFVVARLAHRHGVRVGLLESSYGGVRAVVLIPTSVLAPQENEAEEAGSATNWFGTVAPADEVAAATHAERQPVAAVARASATSISAAVEEGARHRAEPRREDAPRWPTAEPADGDRPPLPRRRRQTHIAPQLRDDHPARADDQVTTDDDAAQAQSMMAAFQRGTEQGRADTDPWDTYRH